MLTKTSRLLTRTISGIWRLAWSSTDDMNVVALNRFTICFDSTVWIVAWKP